MQNTGGGEVRRVVVKVFGFTDVERHALNTVFRLSESRPVVYAAWAEDSPQKAQVALVDGDSWEATIELANPGNDKLCVIWVGQRPSSDAVRVFERPLQWAAILEGLDDLYASNIAPEIGSGVHAPAAQALDFDISAPVALDIDFDLDLGAEAVSGGHGSDADTTTEPASLEPGAPEIQGERVLVVEADPGTRLYLRAKLANAGLLLMDEAATGTEAMALMASHSYALALVDVGMADMDGWKLARQVGQHLSGAGQMVVMRDKLSLMDKWRASRAGAKIALAKPLHPRELKHLLADIGRPLRH